jgi:hypothetical protein
VTDHGVGTQPEGGRRRSDEPNNGLRLRGLTVLRGEEVRDWPILANVGSLFAGLVPDLERRWFTLTVVDDASGEVVATRRFERRRDREDARQVLDAAIRSMGDDELSSTSWSALADSL